MPKHLLKLVIFLEAGKTELIPMQMTMILRSLNPQPPLAFTYLMRRTCFCIWLDLKLRVINLFDVFIIKIFDAFDINGFYFLVNFTEEAGKHSR